MCLPDEGPAMPARRWRAATLFALLIAGWMFAPKLVDSMTSWPTVQEPPVDFAQQIQPLLRKHCYACHGPDKQKGGLRLDDRQTALQGGDRGPILVAKESGKSLILRLITGQDEEIGPMPPTGERLSQAEIDLLRRWIDEGAAWPDTGLSGKRSNHWSFQPLSQAAPPKVSRASWVRQPIDAFVLAHLEKQGVAPSPEADPATLLRRVHLDLTGLPPMPAAVDAYLADHRPGAYERLIDQLLASPHFGEQWGRHWLDLARYADSDGYEKDLDRPHAWRWRDWVIDAYNADVPFDQFTRWQLAGDLIEPGGPAHWATGFLRNTLLNREGGVDVEEDRVKIATDRVNTLGAVWLGMTLGCAECHSHKYDPISQREYYELYAFFNSLDERDMIAPVKDQQEELARQRLKLEAARKAYVDEQRWSKDKPRFAEWLDQVQRLPAVWFGPDSYELPTFGANNGANLYEQEDGSFLVTGTVGGNTHYIMMSNLKRPRVAAIRVEAMTDDMLPRFGPGWAANGNFVLSELRVEAASLEDVTQLRAVPVAEAIADFSQEGFPIEHSLDGNEKTGWAVDQPKLGLHANDRCAVFLLKEPIEFAAGIRLKVTLVQHNGHAHTLGRLRVTYTDVDPSTLKDQAVPQRIRDLARTVHTPLSLEDEATLKRYFDATHEADDPAFQTYTQALAEYLQARGQVRTQVVTERQRKRPTHIHVRGDFLHHGDLVAWGTPKVFPPLRPKVKEQPTRLDLADWLMAPDHPLTARVAVNRIWKHLFGQGLVATLADFGAQGDKPSHPELLDWLAREFIAQGWSQKKLIRTILLSSTYRQASLHRPELLEKDPQNRWLARQNRFRLIAENVRDQYLASSGLLDARIGGPSVAANSHRRGMYLKLKRSFPEPLLITFDAPQGTVTCPLRDRSNTPLQALSLLNDPLYVECAQRLARRIGEAAAADEAEQLAHLYRCCVARRPNAVEQSALQRLLHKARQTYREQPDLAKALAKHKPEPLSETEWASWVVVARTILNLDEVITRE